MEVHVLEVRYTFNGKEDAIYPVILRSKSEVVLVDCGYPGFMPLLEKAANTFSLSLDQLTGILITHHDYDHMGALQELKAAYPSITIYAPELEQPYISGQRKSLRLQQAEDLYDTLPDDQKPGAQQFQEMLRSLQPVAVDETFKETGPLPFMPEVEVIPSPGHMPGHISLYLRDEKTLLAADALVVENGTLHIANPAFTLDLPQAVTSVRKLQQLELHKIICYHGGILEGDPQAHLQELSQQYAS